MMEYYANNVNLLAKTVYILQFSVPVVSQKIFVVTMKLVNAMIHTLNFKDTVKVTYYFDLSSKKLVT